MSRSTRRRFIGQISGGLAAGAALPEWLTARESRSRFDSLGAVAREAAARPLDEAFWELVKQQFPLDPDLVIMNAANLCPSPYRVQEAVFRWTRDEDGDPSFHNRAKFDDLREEARLKIATYVNASPDEIAITRNTSEGNNTVVQGLDLSPNDEVVLWDQNHPTNNIAWDVRAQRWGLEVTRVTTPPNPRSASELVAAFERALTPSTRVLSFSHVSNATGVALPAAELCALARERGIYTLVDGAQSCGALRIDLAGMGCDFYTSSAHKWLMGPKEAGVLYVRRDRAQELWATDVGVGWQSALEGGARKFENLGQRDDAAVSAMASAIEFHEAIGAGNVDQRVRDLATAIIDGVRDRVPGVEFHTPNSAALRAGVVVLQIPDADHAQLYNSLYADHKIACAARGGAFPGLRFSPHVYNTMADVERVLDRVASYV